MLQLTPPSGRVVAVRRCLAWFVALLVALQAVLVPAQRTADQAHVHRQVQPVLTAASTWLKPPAATGFFRHKRDTQQDHHTAHGRHEGAAHVHEPGRDDVVYVAAHEPVSAAAPTAPLKRLSLDVDAALQRDPVVPVLVSRPAPDGQVALRFDSRTEAPLERPPRGRA